jgi:hypothetical protein
MRIIMMRSRMLTALAATGTLLSAAIAPALAAEFESPGNNLSYPVLWSETDRTLPLRGAMDAPVVEGVVLTGHETTEPTSPECLGAVQKDAKNTWQADNLVVPGNAVSIVDWGDKLEARDAGSQQQAIRVETSLYAAVPADMMTRYEMCYIEGQGPDEVWGLRLVTDAEGRPEFPHVPVTTDSTEAMVFTAGARLTIQRIVPSRTYMWDPTIHRWIGSGADTPIFSSAVHEKTADGPGTYGAEVTVSGKITYGYNWMTGGVPQGEYRLTFSLDGPTGTFPGTGTSLATAQLLVSEEGDAAVDVSAEEVVDEGGEGMGNTAVIDGAQNLSYIDIGFGSRTDPVPPLDEPTVPSTGGSSGAGTSGDTATAQPAPQAPVAQQGPEQVTAPTAATARIAQTARIRAQASGRYPVGAVIVLARQPVKTSAGVTVWWRATTETRKMCTVKTVKGKSTATLVKRGTCRVVGWAPAPSADYLPFTVQRTYRAVR